MISLLYYKYLVFSNSCLNLGTDGGIWNEVYDNNTLETGVLFFFQFQELAVYHHFQGTLLNSFHNWPWEVFLLYVSGLHSHLHIYQGTPHSASGLVSCRSGILSKSHLHSLAELVLDLWELACIVKREGERVPGLGALLKICWSMEERWHPKKHLNLIGGPLTPAASPPWISIFLGVPPNQELLWLRDWTPTWTDSYRTLGVFPFGSICPVGVSRAPSLPLGYSSCECVLDLGLFLCW